MSGRALVLADVDARPDLVLRLGERVLVALVEPEEGRDVEALLVLVVPLAAVQELGQALAERVRELGDDARELAVAAVAPVERDRVEDVAEHPQLGEREDALDLPASLGAEPDDRLLEGRPVSVHVVAVVERDGVRAVDREEAEPPLELRQLVVVEQEVRDRVAERVRARLAPRVDERAGVERRSHQVTPSSAAARTPEANPSSWKPFPWYAPA